MSHEVRVRDRDRVRLRSYEPNHLLAKYYVKISIKKKYIRFYKHNILISNYNYIKLKLEVRAITAIAIYQV